MSGLNYYKCLVGKRWFFYDQHFKKQQPKMFIICFYNIILKENLAFSTNIVFYNYRVINCIEQMLFENILRILLPNNTC